MKNDSNRVAFIQILEDYKKMIFKIANSYTSNEEDRRDLMQEITLQLWKSFPRYNSEYKLSTWIYRIALNTSISYYRKEKKRIKSNSNEQDFILRVDIQSELQEERIQQLYGFIHQLNELDKALMILYLEQRSYEEIAEVLGITKTNVATKISRIKTKLKSYFLKLNHNQ